ncbi:MAG: hypothetical protein HKN14_07275 [Marinicaulis sp.]|nr:hypothetical protein [Marinicaulis sp.]NNL87681.1 hypothetical protein [Marinicaulis sp.]
MRILITLILWAVIFGLGGLTGDRYGMPEMLTNMTDGGFEYIEGMLPGGDDS